MQEKPRISEFSGIVRNCMVRLALALVGVLMLCLPLGVTDRTDSSTLTMAMVCHNNTRRDALGGYLDWPANPAKVLMIGFKDVLGYAVADLNGSQDLPQGTLAWSHGYHSWRCSHRGWLG